MKRILLCVVLFLSVQALLGAPVLEEGYSEIDNSLSARQIRARRASALSKWFKERSMEEKKEKCCGWGS